MKLRNPFRPRYMATIIGLESGTKHPVPFVTFRKRQKAQAWVDEMNARKSEGEPLTVYAIQDLR